MHTVYKIYVVVLLVMCILFCSFVYIRESFDNLPQIKSPVGVINDDAYIISLDDKLFQKAKENLSPYLTTSIYKFDAIKGSTLKEFNPNLMTIGAYRSILYNVNRRTHADLGSFNAVGCALSHATLWKNVKPGGGMYIFESDAILTENPEPYVKEFLKTKNPHLLLFGPISKSSSKVQPKIKKVNYHFFGTHGYYITYEGAQLLLKYFYPIEQQVDSYISDFILIDSVGDDKIHFGINVYIINPGISYQYNVDGSTIQTKQVSILSQ